MDNILNIILINTYTLSELRHRVSALKSFLEQHFFGGVKPTDLSDKDTAWINSLPSTFLQSFNKDNLSTVFESLQREITQLKTLTLYLTFDPDSQTDEQIGEYVKANFKERLILDIKYNPNLIAGAGLVWKGVYKDYSLKSKIDQRKMEILESFKKFLR